jgi:hypothetical protein
MSASTSDLKSRPRSRSPPSDAVASDAPVQDPASVGQLPADAEKRALYAAEVRAQERALAADPRFARAPPSAWKRGALLLFVAALFWMAVRMRMALATQQRVPEVEFAAR